MSLYFYLLVIIFSSAGFWLVRVWMLRSRIEQIVKDKGFDASKTFYSISSFKRIVIYTFTPEGLLVNLKTNVFFPALSLISKESLIKYEDIDCVEIGQSTTTLKLKQIASANSVLFRYGTGALATLGDSTWRVFYTSKPTYASFAEQLKQKSVKVIDSATTLKSAIILSLFTAVVLVSVLTVMYFVIL